MKLAFIDKIPEVEVSHNKEIKKKVMIGNDVIPSLTNFSTSIFKSGQTADNHKHDTMYEVFHVQHGTIEFVVNGEKMVLNTGDTITIEPSEYHSIHNSSKQDVRLLYFGISTDGK